MRLSPRSANRTVLSTGTTQWVVPVSLVVLIGVWYLATDVARVASPLFLPSPSELFASAVELVRGDLPSDIAATMLRVIASFLISVIAALPVALLMSESQFFRKLLAPYIDFIRYIPVPILVPLTILFFGIGEESKIVLLFIGTFFQLVLLFMADLSRVPREYYDLAHSLHFSRSERLSMKMQAALPGMVENMRISLGLCWSYVIIAELVAADAGLGHLIKEAQRFSQTSEVYVGILVMGLIGFLSDIGFRSLEQRLFPYREYPWRS